MLARVAARSFRPYGLPVQTILPHSFLRSYAKHNKPKRPNDDRPHPNAVPINRHGPDTWTSPGPLEAATRPSFAVSASQTNHQSSNPTLQNASNFKSKEPSPPIAEGPSTNEESTPPVMESSESNMNYGNPTSQNKFEKEQKLSHLPDLTRGIPSTLDSEMAEAASAARADSRELEIAEDPSQSAGGREEGELPKTEYISSIERRKSRVARYLYASFLGWSMLGTIYLGRNWANEEEERKHPDAPSGWGFSLFYNRASARLRDILDYYNEPSFTKLLPDPDPIWARPYTLVLSLEDLLVHSEWTREHGWRMAKRPGVDYFLRYLNQYYEIVIFTSVPSMIGDPIVRSLDPFRIVIWTLFREATRFKQGQYIKDLSFLNRDLSKVIMIDTVAAHTQMQPENAIILQKWEGDLRDNELVSLIPFLEYAASMEFDDTRKVLESFEGKHIPVEFAQREAVARERFQKEWAEERAKRPRRSGVGFLGSALGIKPMNTGFDGMDQGVSRGFDEGKSYLDQVRERGQKNYEMFEKEIRENEEKWLQEMAQEEKKMRGEAMKGWKSSMLGSFGGSPEKP